MYIFLNQRASGASLIKHWFLRWAVIAAMATTSIAVVLILINASTDISLCSPHNAYPSLQPTKFVIIFPLIF